MEINVELIRESFEAAKPIMSKVLDHFYKTLFKNYPQVQPLFKDVDMKRQKTALGGALSFAVENLHDTQRLKRVLLEMGAKHKDYGVTTEQYEWVGATLIETLAHFFGESWTEELETHWAATYQFIATTMLKGASQKAKKAQQSSTKVINVKEYSQTIARDILLKALKQEIQNIQKIAREQAREVLKAAIEEEAKALIKAAKTDDRPVGAVSGGPIENPAPPKIDAA